MKSSSSYLRFTAREWAWGRPAYWKVYSSLKIVVRPYLDKCTISTLSALCYKFCGAHEDDNCTVCSRHRRVRNRRGTYHGCYEPFLSLNGKFGSILNSSIYSRYRTRHFYASSQKLHSRLQLARKYNADWREGILSKQEINEILRSNENSASLRNSLVSRCEFNQLASNQPMEDQVFAAKSLLEDVLFFGVIDGHGGSAFASEVRDRLPFYISAALAKQSEDVDVDNDDKHLKTIASDIFINSNSENGKHYWESKVVEYLADVWSQNRRNSNKGMLSYMSMPLRQIFGTRVLGDYPDEPPSIDISKSLKEAFLRLDQDMISEITHNVNKTDTVPNNLDLALSGCCAVVACVAGKDLYVANAGDCRAVLGTCVDGTWNAVQLTQDHTAVSNPDEVKRIFLEHPREEMRSCIQYGRLLGRLAPLRAFGDIQFKLDASLQKEIFTSALPNFQTSPSLKTPPYLTAEPDVFCYRLTSQDRFAVLASDGLWDMLGNQEVVELVGSYMEGKGVEKMRQKPCMGANPHIESVLHASCDDVNEDNVATFLIRFALGGCDQYSLSTMLTLPHPEVRMYRDDISVTVIFFKHDE